MSERFYQCPACGNETIVWRTDTYAKVIVRLRKCMVCGFKHRTEEKALEPDAPWDEVMPGALRPLPAPTGRQGETR